VDEELARRAQDPERAPGHAEIAMVGVGDGIDLELVADCTQGRVYV
jgi:hypothetical protein